MLRPSYAELMDVLNRETEDSDEITSRYTIVIAAAKRARQLIDGDEPMVAEKKGKPLSTAVDELYNSKIKVVPEGEGTIVHVKGESEVHSSTDKLENNSNFVSDEDESEDEDIEDIENIDSDDLVSDDNSEN